MKHMLQGLPVLHEMESRRSGKLTFNDGVNQAAAGCLANMRESLQRRQAQESQLVKGLVAARKTLRDQAVTLDSMAALTAELQELRHAQACFWTTQEK